MNPFYEDDAWQKQIRDALLKPFYVNHSFDGRFIFADKGKLADKLQQMESDTVMQLKENSVLAIEEKIVRWPERNEPYTAFTLETWSCTSPGHERKGWMYTAECDYLMYCFVQADSQSAIMYAIPFPELKAWFFENDHYLKYHEWTSTQINKTACRVVPIADVVKAIPKTKKITLPEEPDF